MEHITANNERVWLSPARASFSARVHGRPDGVSGRKTGAGEKNPCVRGERGSRVSSGAERICVRTAKLEPQRLKPDWFFRPYVAAKQFGEKGFSGCHSERSEESLCAECQEKERFLVAPLLGMTRLWIFSASCKATTHKDSQVFTHTLKAPYLRAHLSAGLVVRVAYHRSPALRGELRDFAPRGKFERLW